METGQPTHPPTPHHETEVPAELQAFLQQYVGPLQRQVQELVTAYNTSSNALGRLQRENETLRAQQVVLESQLDGRIPRSHDRRPKIPVPEFFHGATTQSGDKERKEARKEFDNWSGQVRSYIRMRPEEFPDETAKCMFAAAYLRDAAYRWAKPYTDAINGGQTVPIFESLDKFLKSLQAAFGEANATGNARKELLELRQTATVTEYAAEFRALRTLVEWQASDQTFIDIYRNGLSNRFLTDLAGRTTPTQFDEFVQYTCQLDDDLRASRPRWKNFSSESRHDKGNATGRANAHTSTPRAPAARDPNAMEVDQTRRDDYLRKGLCFNCGKRGHRAAQCTTTPRGAPSVQTIGTPPSRAATPATIVEVAEDSEATSSTSRLPINAATPAPAPSVDEAMKVLLAHLAKGQGFN